MAGFKDRLAFAKGNSLQLNWINYFVQVVLRSVHMITISVIIWVNPQFLPLARATSFLAVNDSPNCCTNCNNFKVRL